MRVRRIGMTALVGASCLFGQYIISPQLAYGATTTPVAFGNANFSGYGTGDEVHLGALDTSTINIADLEQAFSTASTNSKGLTSVLTDTDTGTTLQPAEGAAKRAYAGGSGLELGLAASTTAGADANQILLAGKAETTAPATVAPVTKTISPGTIPGLGTVGLLNSEAAATYDSSYDTCPLGQPISYGVGDAASASLLNASTVPVLGTLLGGIAGNGNLITTTGMGTSTAHSDSETYLNSNGDGTFGLATQARETVAPITINLGGVLQLEITVSGTSINDPVTLTTTTTGNSTGATATLTDNALIGINAVITAGGTTTTVPVLPNISLSDLVGEGGVNVDLGPNLLSSLTSSLSGIPALGSTLSSLLGTLTSALPSSLTSLLPELGTLQVGTPPKVQVEGGTFASADFNIVKVALGGTGTALPSVVNLEVGHLQSEAADAAPITCTIPVIKTSSAPSVTPGNNFVYTIEVPDPAKLNLIDCNLTNVSVVDTISDDTGNPTFQVIAANDGGKITQTSTTNATISWSGLTYVMPNVIVLTITVHVPTSSPTGVFLDNVKAVGTASGCSGGASGITNLGGVNGTSLNGADTITAPKTTALTAAAVTSTGSGSGSLPTTGGEGGLWQPALGLAALVLGGGGLVLARRSRRRPPA